MSEVNNHDFPAEFARHMLTSAVIAAIFLSGADNRIIDASAETPADSTADTRVTQLVPSPEFCGNLRASISGLLRLRVLDLDQKDALCKGLEFYERRCLSPSFSQIPRNFDCSMNTNNGFAHPVFTFPSRVFHPPSRKNS